MAAPANGAMYESAAGSEAPATTMIVCFMASCFQFAHDAGNFRFFLADGDVDTDHVLTFLVDDRVDRDRGFAGLAVADDQFALAFADWNHGIDGFDACLQAAG
jgi:hypothetical protein